MPHRSKYGPRPAATTLDPSFDSDILEQGPSTTPPTQTIPFLTLPAELRNVIYALALEPSPFQPGARKIPNLSPPLLQTNKQIRAEATSYARSAAQQYWSDRHLSPPTDTGPRGLEIYLAPTCTGRTVAHLLADDVVDRFDYLLIYVGSRSDLAPRSAAREVRPRAVYVWRPRGRVEGCEVRKVVHGDGEGGWIACLERVARERIEAARGTWRLGWYEGGEDWVRRVVLGKILYGLDGVYELERKVKSVWRTVLAAKRGVVNREVREGFYLEPDK